MNGCDSHMVESEPGCSNCFHRLMGRYDALKGELKASEGPLRIVCDNAHHDRGSGICSFCVQKRIDKAVEAANLQVSDLTAKIQHNYEVAEAARKAMDAALVERNDALRQIEELRGMWESSREAVKNVTAIVGEVTAERDAANRLNVGLKESMNELIKEALWCSSNDYADSKDLDQNDEVIKKAKALLGIDLNQKPDGCTCGTTSHVHDGNCAMAKRKDEDPRRGCIDFGHKGPMATSNEQTGIRCTNCGELVG